jgi:hypothetical protein
VIVGRRGGKSLIAALVAVFLACFKDYSAVLAPGARSVVRQSRPNGSPPSGRGPAPAWRSTARFPRW